MVSWRENNIKGEIKMQNQIIEKAQELGKLISDSEIRKAAQEAADKMNNDETAVKMLAAYNETRRLETEKLRGKEPTKEELEAFKKLMEEEFSKLMKNDIIATYVAANKELDLLVEQVNAVLAYYISGEEQHQHGGGCSGNCSSCSSCH